MLSDESYAEFISRAKSFDLDLNESELKAFERYYNELFVYNSHTNLVANTEEEEVYIKHFLDSLAFSLVEEDKDRKFSLLDFGCGGGFPGVPILIVYKQATLVAVDSVGKKIRFVDKLSTALGIGSRLVSKNARIEDLESNNREFYDYITARAVAPLSMLVEYCVPYLKVGGQLVAYKSKTAEEEISTAENALRLLHAEVADVKDYKIDSDSVRKLVVIEKTAPSDKQYPRKNGLVKKHPLW